MGLFHQRLFLKEICDILICIHVYIYILFIDIFRARTSKTSLKWEEMNQSEHQNKTKKSLLNNGHSHHLLQHKKERMTNNEDKIRTTDEINDKPTDKASESQKSKKKSNLVMKNTHKSASERSDEKCTSNHCLTSMTSWDVSTTRSTPVKHRCEEHEKEHPTTLPRRKADLWHGESAGIIVVSP